MARPVKILASCRDAATADAISAALADSEGVRLDIRDGLIVRQLKDQWAKSDADVIIVDLKLGDDDELGQLSDLLQNLPVSVSVVATANNATVDQVRLLMRLGIADFVPQPIAAEDLQNSISVTLNRAPMGRDGSQSWGRILSFVRPSGGMGATSLAVQAAYCLANDVGEKRRVCLVDFDLQAGNAGLYLDIESSVGVYDCLATPERLDTSLVRSVVTPHRAGFDVLPAPAEYVAIDAIAPDTVLRLMDVLRAEYQVVVVDTPPVMTHWVEALLGESDTIVLVTQLTVAGVRQAARQLNLLAGQDIDTRSVHIVANRSQKTLFPTGDITVRRAEQALKHRIVCLVPSDYGVISRAINEGKAVPQIRRRTPFEKSVRRLVREVLSEPPQAAPGHAAG